MYFRYTLLVSILWVVIEPLLSLYAIGYGLGGFVGEIDGISYAEFFAPALMLASAMLVAYFESTYPTYTKLNRRQTFAAILLTPVMPRDIGYGEIWWAASKGFLSAVGVAIAALIHGLVDTWMLIPALAIAFMVSWIFAAFGLLITTYARNYDWFIYAQTGILMPLYFFSGTFFPLSHLPSIAENLAWCSPLTHAISAVRLVLASDWEWTLLINLVVLVSLGAWITHVSVRRLEDKLIQ